MTATFVETEAIIKPQTRIMIEDIDYKIPTQGVYAIRNMITGATYIGQSRNTYFRMGAHSCHLRKNRHYCQELQLDVTVNGWENFSFQMIEEVADRKDLLIREAAIQAQFEEAGIIVYSKTKNVRKIEQDMAWSTCGEERIEPFVRHNLVDLPFREASRLFKEYADRLPIEIRPCTSDYMLKLLIDRARQGLGI